MRGMEKVSLKEAQSKDKNQLNGSGRKCVFVCVYVYACVCERESVRKIVCERERGIERGAEQVLLDLSQLCTNKEMK